MKIITTTVGDLIITHTKWEQKHNYSKKVGNNFTGDYIYHSATAWCNLIINDKKYFIQYENGACFLMGDYDCPDNDMGIDMSYSSNLAKILEDHTDDKCTSELLKEVIEECPEINTIEKLEAVQKVYYDLVRTYTPTIRDYNFSENLEDYTEDENGYLHGKDCFCEACH